jgi:hypothetical protein
MATRDFPFFKFYPSDWRSDQALAICSAAARGLWIELLCLMHTAEGYLLVNGMTVTEAQLSVLTRIPPEQLPDLLLELEKAGVFSRTRSGVIFSRRMLRDKKRSKIGRKSVNKRYGQDIDNKEKKKPPNRSPSRLPSTPIPEARSQIPDKRKIPKEKVDPLLMAFRKATAGVFGGEAVPPFFPSQTDRAMASILAGKGITPDALQKAVRTAQEARNRAGSTPINTLKYFEYLLAESEQANGEENKWHDRIKTYLDRKIWFEPAWGPPPETPGTFVPNNVLAAYGFEIDDRTAVEIYESLHGRPDKTLF